MKKFLNVHVDEPRAISGRFARRLVCAAGGFSRELVITRAPGKAKLGEDEREAN
jgi:hypothetical protein